jgi:flagellar biosynthesis GTPase FlhF
VVDEKKVRLMTRLAIYEKKEKDKGLIRSKYFQGDYVRYNVLKTMVSSTIVFWGVLGYYAFMNFDSLLAKVSDVDYFDVMYKLIGWYVTFCVIYFLIASLLYNYRYEKSKRGLISYNSDLRDLIELEGGPMHHSKLVREDSRTVGAEQSLKNDSDRGSVPRTASTARTSVNRSELVRQRQQEQDKLREEQIKKNAARLAAQAEERDQKERQAAADREKIQERRKQLEREQLERIRREQQQMMRENYTYTGDNMSQNYSGNINRTNDRKRTNVNHEGRKN